MRTAGGSQARQRKRLSFREKNALIGGRAGYADVFRRGLFAWENKASGKSLDAALPRARSGLRQRQLLFFGLKTLKDIEQQSHIEAATRGLDREADLVTGPHNMLGIELKEYAAELARATVWIGELQWRLLHGYEFKTIRC